MAAPSHASGRRCRSSQTAERAVADWVLADPQRALHASMAQIAAACDVSDTTVLRLCRTTGHDGFTAFRFALAQDLATPVQLIHDDAEPHDDLTAVVQKVFGANVTALYDTASTLDLVALERFLMALESASAVLVAGVGASGVVAQALHHRLRRLGRPSPAPMTSSPS